MDRSRGEPRVETPRHVVGLVPQLGDPAPGCVVVDRDEVEALSEAGARRAPGPVEDPGHHLARDGLAGVVAHHPPAANDLLELHRSPFSARTYRPRSRTDRRSPLLASAAVSKKLQQK